MMQSAKAKALCSGCRENFYHGYNDLGVKECWHYKGAKVVKRYRIGWHMPQDKAENFDEVTVLSCYCQTGTAAYYEQLPAHLRQRVKR